MRRYIQSDAKTAELDHSGHYALLAAGRHRGQDAALAIGMMIMNRVLMAVTWPKKTDFHVVIVSYTPDNVWPS